VPIRRLWIPVGFLGAVLGIVVSLAMASLGQGKNKAAQTPGSGAAKAATPEPSDISLCTGASSVSSTEPRARIREPASTFCDAVVERSSSRVQFPTGPDQGLLRVSEPGIAHIHRGRQDYRLSSARNSVRRYCRRASKDLFLHRQGSDGRRNAERILDRDQGSRSVSLARQSCCDRPLQPTMGPQPEQEALTGNSPVHSNSPTSRHSSTSGRQPLWNRCTRCSDPEWN
jgi:hypothetical protein